MAEYKCIEFIWDPDRVDSRALHHRLPSHRNKLEQAKAATHNVATKHKTKSISRSNQTAEGL